MRESKGRVSNILSWILLICMVLLFLFSCKSIIETKKTGEPSFVLGYRLIYVTSGSMEPTIKTHGMALTKEVQSIDDVKENDIISFTVRTDDGSLIRTTHRIYKIEDDGKIYTKGDNNTVVDSYPITISNIESKVCCTFNFTAWWVELWQSGISGRILIFSIIIFIILIYVGIKIIYPKRKECR